MLKGFFMCCHSLLIFTFSHWRKKVLHTPHYTNLLKICQTITCRASFYFGISFSFGLYLWNIQPIRGSPLIFECVRILSFQFLKPSRYVRNSFSRYVHFLKIKSTISLFSCETRYLWQIVWFLSTFISLGTQQL